MRNPFGGAQVFTINTRSLGLQNYQKKTLGIEAEHEIWNFYGNLSHFWTFSYTIFAIISE
jgi:hypothetical protein